MNTECVDAWIPGGIRQTRKTLLSWNWRSKRPQGQPNSSTSHQTPLCLVSIATVRLSRRYCERARVRKYPSQFPPTGTTELHRCHQLPERARWVAALCKLAFVCPFFSPGFHPMDSAISTTASLIKHLRNSELICNIESVLE